MAGNPNVNDSFLVLWLNKYMPIVVPREPPNKASANKLFSEILLAFLFFEADLSIPMTNSPMILMIII